MQQKMQFLLTINWKRVFITGFFSFLWLQIIVVALGAWPDGSMLDRSLMYKPTGISPTSILFVASLLIGFYYATYTHNYLFLACVVLGIIGFWRVFGLENNSLFPTLKTSFNVFAALYVAAFMTRLSTDLTISKQISNTAKPNSNSKE